MRLKTRTGRRVKRRATRGYWTTFALVCVTGFTYYIQWEHVGTSSRLLLPALQRQLDQMKNDRALPDDQLSFVPPVACTGIQQSTILAQLPRDECDANARRRPWTNACSFSYATCCPDPTWLVQYWQTQHAAAVRQQTQGQHARRTAIYVGCNKAMDAVNTLRMLSGNPIFDKNQWKDELFRGTKEDGKKVHPGHCGQEFDEQFPLVASPLRQQPHAATVYCIEAMPKTAVHLNATAHRLGWHERLVVSNVAISSTDGTTLFPSAKGGEDTVGVENSGLADCQGKGASSTKNALCSEIPMYRLDTFAEHEIQTSTLIDFLSIDVEGFDWEVLKGAPQLLQRVKYLEFEYNWRGLWQEQMLSDSITTLQDANFICYWTGDAGYLWRITGCWQSHYNHKFWSNVACVNTVLAKDLGTVMEKRFQETIHAGSSIRYDKGRPEPKNQ